MSIQTYEEQNKDSGADNFPAVENFTKCRFGGQKKRGSLWLITFTDVMALMLTFFVLLYAMSVPKEEDWDDMTRGINNQFSKTYSAPFNRGPLDEINIDKIDFSKAQSLSYLNSILSNVVLKDERLKGLVLIPQQDNLIISVPEGLLFESGRADVSDEGKQILFSLGNTLSRIRNRIEVIGHTDPRLIQSVESVFASNWELSLARAGAVASALGQAGYEKPMIIRGLSSARYDDLSDDMPEEERLSLARRVDIVVMNDDGSSRAESQLDILNINP